MLAALALGLQVRPAFQRYLQMGLFDFLKPKPAPAPEPAATLEELLAQAARDPAMQPEFYRRLLVEPLVVLSGQATTPVAPHARTMQPGETIEIASLPDGRVPVFTSPARIFDGGVVTEQVRYTQMKGRNLLEILAGATVVLNPYSDHGKELLPSEVAHLLSGTLLDTGCTITVQQETTVQIGQPAVYPTALVQALARLLSQQPRVRAAYLGWLRDPASDEPPHYLICLDVEGDMQAIAKQTGYVAQQFLQPREIIDIIQAGENDLTSYFLTTKPFYKR